MKTILSKLESGEISANILEKAIYKTLLQHYADGESSVSERHATIAREVAKSVTKNDGDVMFTVGLILDRHDLKNTRKALLKNISIELDLTKKESDDILSMLEITPSAIDSIEIDINNEKLNKNYDINMDNAVLMPRILNRNKIRV